MIALCDGHQRRALTTVKVGCKKTFPGRPSAIKFTKFRPKKFFQTFRQICILALLLCAVTAFQLQYWIRFGTWLWLGESKLMLMKLLGGFPILTDLAGQGFQRCVVFEVFALKRDKHSDLSLNLIQSLKLWEELRIGVHGFILGQQVAADWSFVAFF